MPIEWDLAASMTRTQSCKQFLFSCVPWNRIFLTSVVMQSWNMQTPDPHFLDHLCLCKYKRRLFPATVEQTSACVTHAVYQTAFLPLPRTGRVNQQFDGLDTAISLPQLKCTRRVRPGREPLGLLPIPNESLTEFRLNIYLCVAKTRNPILTLE